MMLLIKRWEVESGIDEENCTSHLAPATLTSNFAALGKVSEKFPRLRILCLTATWISCPPLRNEFSKRFSQPWPDFPNQVTSCFRTGGSMPIPKAAVVIPVYTVQRWAQMKIKSNLVHFAGQTCRFNSVNTQYILTLYHACWYARKSSLMRFPRYIQSYSPIPQPPPPSHTHILGHQPIFICFLNNYQIAYSFLPMFLYVNNFACLRTTNFAWLVIQRLEGDRRKTGKKSWLSSDCYKRELFCSVNILNIKFILWITIQNQSLFYYT